MVYFKSHFYTSNKQNSSLQNNLMNTAQCSAMMYTSRSYMKFIVQLSNLTHCVTFKNRQKVECVVEFGSSLHSFRLATTSVVLIREVLFSFLLHFFLHFNETRCFF